MTLSGKKVLILIAPENFQDTEYQVPRDYFLQQGAQVFVASSKREAMGKYGLRVTVDISLDQAEQECADYDAVVVVGGSGVRQYFENPAAKNLCRSTLAAGKVLAAICAAPGLLAHAGVLRDRTATSHESEADTLRQFGAQYTGNVVTIDGNIVTANGPDAAQEFGEKIATLLQ